MRHRFVAEAVGTGLLLHIIVGSGIAAQQVGTDGATQLLAHALVVGIGLGVLIVLFQSVSGSHFNPSVTLAFWRGGTIDGTTASGYIGAQLVGALAGVGLANLTFGEQVYSVSATPRDGLGLVVAEGIATFVLVFLILALVRLGLAPVIPAAVGGWVAVIVFATASTGFANPAVTVSRIFTDTYTGIAPGSAWGFLAVQIVAGLVAAPIAALLYETSATQRASA
jgi:glycerol uptake facilitator-like aquaporin